MLSIRTISGVVSWFVLNIGREIGDRQGEGVLGRGIASEVALRADAAFAKPEMYEALEQRGVQYAIRIPANESPERNVAQLLPRAVGRPGRKPLIEYKSFLYRATS